MSVVAVYRVKNEARWIAESIARTSGVADRILVLDDHSDDDTAAQAARAAKTEVIRSPFGALDEARDRQFLIQRAHAAGARWIVCLDGDEVLTPSAVEEMRQIIENDLRGCYFFRIAYLWDSPDQERVDGAYANIRAACLYSITGARPESLTFPKTRHGGNLHCNRLPQHFIGARREACAAVKHYGYMLADERARKHAFYNTNDTPEGRAIEDRYDHIIGKPSRWAPGPVRLAPFKDE